MEGLGSLVKSPEVFLCLPISGSVPLFAYVSVYGLG